MSEAGFLHDLRRRGRDVAILACLTAFTRLDRCVDFESSEDFVTHAIVVQSESEVSLDLDSLGFTDV